MAIHLNSGDLTSQAKVMIELEENQEEKDADLNNCISLMESIGVEPIVGTVSNSTPIGMIMNINSYENTRNATKKASLKVLMVAGIAAIPLTVRLLSKTNTESAEIIRWAVIAVSAVTSALSVSFGLEKLFEAGMIKDYIEACKTYIRKYYPHLENKINKPVGKAIVKK